MGACHCERHYGGDRVTARSRAIEFARKRVRACASRAAAKAKPHTRRCTSAVQRLIPSRGDAPIWSTGNLRQPHKRARCEYNRSSGTSWLRRRRYLVAAAKRCNHGHCDQPDDGQLPFANGCVEEGVTMDLTTLERLPLWIGGRAYSPTTTRYGEVTNPATGEVIRHVPFANAADVDAAVAAAARRVSGMVDHACVATCARADEIPRPARPPPQGPGADRHAGTWQDARRCRRLGDARDGSGRVRNRHSAPAEGRAQRQRRHRRRQLVAFARRSACAWASRRSIFRRWCRCGCSRSRSAAATRSC